MANKRFSFPLEGRFSLAFKAFTNTERNAFFVASSILVVTTLVLLYEVNRSFMVEIPARGGSLTEGILSIPAHINPLLATSEIGSEADRDLTALVYSGLLRIDKDGNFIPDLAESYTVSEDGLTYTFILKPGLVWHDGEKITSEDITFTVKTAQDNRIKSPKRVNWDGVSVENPDNRTIVFTLKKPYAPFLENATLGILPKHIWETVDFNRFDSSNYNREPIGSGPYKIDSIETTTKDGDKIPVSYTLRAFNKFALGEPNITTIKIVFYRTGTELENALVSGKVEAINSISPDSAKKLSEQGFEVVHTPLPRVFAVFFNQNEAPLFLDPSVRKALSLTVDKQQIIDKVLASYGTPLDGPIPPGSLGYSEAKAEPSREKRLALARSTLEKGGWRYNEKENHWVKTNKKETVILRFSISTSEAPELKAVTEELRNSWSELGIPVEIRVFATGDLKESIMRPRKFEALFFGQVLGRDGDPYPFWHSSQRLDPGLNITSYTNQKADKILENARKITDQNERVLSYETFKKEISNDSPAIFIYSPEFLYVAPKNIHGVDIKFVSNASERFLDVYQWYIKTDNVWKIFTK